MAQERLTTIEGISMRVPPSREGDVDDLFLQLGIEDYRKAPVYNQVEGEYIHVGYEVELITGSREHRSQLMTSIASGLVNANELVLSTTTTLNVHKATLLSIGEHMSLDQPAHDLVDFKEIVVPPCISNN
jgi:hypothetical protein